MPSLALPRPLARLGWSLPALLIGCGHVRIQDPAVLQAASAVGESSAALVASRHASDPAQVEAQALAVESALVELALAHDRWETVPTEWTRLPPVPAPEDALRWEERQLRGGLELPAGGHLQSGLRFLGNRTESLSPSETVESFCQGGEVTGSDSVWCPPFVDRRLRVERPVLVDDQPMTLRLEADYGLHLDGRGCAAGGQVEVSWVLAPDSGAESRGGFVSADFQGCGRTAASTFHR